MGKMITGLIGLKKIDVIDGNIYHFSFDTARNLNKTFLRFQEHYESPQFQGKSFTLNEFKTWYKSFRGTKNFTYHSDWTGNNFPDKTLRYFYEGCFDPLTKREKLILEFFREVNAPFYMIGTTEQTKDVFDFEHELAHALFYLKAGYRKQVVKLLSNEKLNAFRMFLFEMGYLWDVLDDEVNAYLCTDPEGIMTQQEVNTHQSLIDKLQELYQHERRQVI